MTGRFGEGARAAHPSGEDVPWGRRARLSSGDGVGSQATAQPRSAGGISARGMDALRSRAASDGQEPSRRETGGSGQVRGGIHCCDYSGMSCGNVGPGGRVRCRFKRAFHSSSSPQSRDLLQRLEKRTVLTLMTNESQIQVTYLAASPASSDSLSGSRPHPNPICSPISGAATF